MEIRNARNDVKNSALSDEINQFNSPIKNY